MAQVPMLVAAPGMHVNEVLRLSSLDLKSPDPSKHHGFVQPPGTPHRLRVKHDRHGFELPEGLFNLLETCFGIVLRILATPHLDYVDASTAVKLMGTLAEALNRAGWEPKVKVDEAVTAEKLARRLRAGFGPWHAGTGRPDSAPGVKSRRAVNAQRPSASRGMAIL